MAKYTPDVRFIASIYPGELPPIRRAYGVTRESVGPGAQRATLFSLPPVPRGERPFVLPVYDSFEDVLDTVGIGAGMGSGNILKPRLPKPVPVDAIVADLLRVWTGGLHNVPPGAKPGVIEIFPMKVELKKWADSGYRADALPGPNPGELDQMLSQQTRYLQYWFQEGERLNAEHKWEQIGVPHRLAAEWLGEKVHWATADALLGMAPCPLCGERIPKHVIVCPNCHQQIKALPAEIAAIRASAPPPSGARA